MNITGIFGAAGFALVACASALGGWGVKYEVNAGSGWTSGASIDVSSGPVAVDFRISVYHDGAMMINVSSWGSTLAVAPLRLCNSQRITNFGDNAFGDSLVSYVATVDSCNKKALESSRSGADLILGTPNSIYSFASNTQMMIPHPVQLEKQFYAGKLLIGNAGSGATSRTITLTANTFSYPGAQPGTGGLYGASFFALRNGSNGNGPAIEAGVSIPAVITVRPSCPGDLDADGTVGDPDFILFSAAQELVECSDGAMLEGCPADLNNDGIVDDADFVIFAAAYDAFVCG
ncbi:MAG: hypothetical protein J0L78_09410 [Planctomycetes bacterium]|nr:hypothetical protein [Planctomycetota bacterium]